MKRPKRINYNPPPEKLAELKRKAMQVEEEREEIIAKGRRIAEQHPFELAMLLCEFQEIRESEELSLAELSRRSGIDEARLSKIFNSQGNPTVRTLHRLADAMGRELKLSLSNPDT